MTDEDLLPECGATTVLIDESGCYKNRTTISDVKSHTFTPLKKALLLLGTKP